MHDARRMPDFGAFGEHTVTREQGTEDALITVQQEPNLGMTATCDRSASENRSRAGVAAHGIK
jgi:hypothetical protein